MAADPGVRDRAGAAAGGDPDRRAGHPLTGRRGLFLAAAAGILAGGLLLAAVIIGILVGVSHENRLDRLDSEQIRLEQHVCQFDAAIATRLHLHVTGGCDPGYPRLSGLWCGM